MVGRRCRVAVSAALLVLGCAKEESHPDPAIINCPDGGKCFDPPPVGGSGGSEGGVGGSSGAAGGDAAVGVTITGTVVLLTGDDFSQAQPFATAATIRMEGADGLPVEGSYDGSTFAVNGVASAAVVWTTVTPKSGDAMPTVQPASTLDGLALELAVVPSTSIDFIYALLSIPATREPGAAHVVLHFVDAKTLDPIPGVQVSHQGEAVAYDTGGSWSDVAGVTGTFGYAVVVNVTAGTVPSKQVFAFSAPTASGGVELQIEPDAVTLADVLIEP